MQAKRLALAVLQITSNEG